MVIVNDSPERFEEIRQRMLKGLSAPTEFPSLLNSINSMIDRGEAPFKSLREFINAPINKDGIGVKEDERLDLLLWYNPHYNHIAKKLSIKLGLAETAKNVDPIGKHGGGRNQGSESENATLARGTAYRIGKLKRDHPLIAKQLEAGEFKSVNEAERAAGTRPPLRESKRVVFFKDDPKAAIKALSEYYGIEVNYEG